MTDAEVTPAICTPHPLATQAGHAVLDAGGTATEAVIAAGAVLAVVCPHFCGLGGDAVWMLADRQGRQTCYLAIGQGIDRQMPDAPIPLRGAGSVLTTAALVDGWRHAHAASCRDWGGTAVLGDLLQPAIGLAEKGFTPTESQRFWTNYRLDEAQDWPGFAPLFLAAGDVLKQPGLARSLRVVAEDASSFYHGALAREIVAGLRDAGVKIGLDDLARTRTREVAPLRLDYRGLTLLAPPAPTQGAATLAIMGTLGRFDFSKLREGSAAHLHLCVEAVKQAFLRRGMLADPAFAKDIGAELMDAALLTRSAAAINPLQASSWPHVWQHGDTAFLAAVDAAGNAASVLQSTYFDWGSGVVAGDTGILWQNRGAAFSTDSGHPNVFAPGKLPFYTLNPGIALRDGKPHLLYGTQGADGQPQTLAMLLTRLIDFGQSPQRSLAASRFLLGRTFSDSRDSLKLEADLDESVIAELARMGHETTAIPSQSPLAGLAGIICIAGHKSSASHDPRGEGTGLPIGN